MGNCYSSRKNLESLFDYICENPCENPCENSVDVLNCVSGTAGTGKTTILEELIKQKEVIEFLSLFELDDDEIKKKKIEAVKAVVLESDTLNEFLSTQPEEKHKMIQARFKELVAIITKSKKHFVFLSAAFDTTKGTLANAKIVLGFKKAKCISLHPHVMAEEEISAATKRVIERHSKGEPHALSKLSQEQVSCVVSNHYKCYQKALASGKVTVLFGNDSAAMSACAAKPEDTCVGAAAAGAAADDETSAAAAASKPTKMTIGDEKLPKEISAAAVGNTSAIVATVESPKDKSPKLYSALFFLKKLSPDILKLFGADDVTHLKQLPTQGDITPYSRSPHGTLVFKNQKIIQLLEKFVGHLVKIHLTGFYGNKPRSECTVSGFSAYVDEATTNPELYKIIQECLPDGLHVTVNCLKKFSQPFECKAAVINKTVQLHEGNHNITVETVVGFATKDHPEGPYN